MHLFQRRLLDLIFPSTLTVTLPNPERLTSISCFSLSLFLFLTPQILRQPYRELTGDLSKIEMINNVIRRAAKRNISPTLPTLLETKEAFAVKNERSITGLSIA